MRVSPSNINSGVDRQLTGLQRLLMLLVIVGLTACSGRRGQQLADIPTLAADPAEAATAQYMTENAPPPGFRQEVSFPDIDAQLIGLPGWRYVVTLEFNGIFARTPRETSATARAEIWYNQLGSSRRVLVETSGELIGQEENNQFEAVRLGPDAFLVRDNTCNTGADAETAADLRAGLLVGGVNRATPTGLRATLNGEEAWQYRFAADDLNLPSIRLDDTGTLAATGEIWVAPEHNAVVRFYVNLDVENAFIFDRQLPVTGQVILRYDLYDIGDAPNLTIPFGC
jgi:hypothetical protein